MTLKNLHSHQLIRCQSPYYRRFRLGIVFFVMCCICFSLSMIRVVKTGAPTFIFLNWNLFLAVIPFLITSYLITRKDQIHWTWRSICIITWLLFLPNAPYILTDMVHFKFRASAPPWYDIAVLHCFAWTGLIIGLKSVVDMQSIISRFTKPIYAKMSIALILFICSFGVYVGRFLRWNSWDVLTRPLVVFEDLFTRILFPMEHPRVWGVTLLYGLLLNMVYWSTTRMKPNQLDYPE